MAIDATTIIEQIRIDAADQVPPFGSEGLKMAVAEGTRISGALQNELDGDPFAAFLALEALRAADPASFERLSPQRRAEIYVRAVEQSSLFNAWGAPQLLSDTSRAFAALGPTAIEVLVPLLANRHAAPQGGSRIATASTVDQVRLRDYAWTLICAALGRVCIWDREPVVRDKAIDALAAELGGSR